MCDSLKLSTIFCAIRPLALNAVETHPVKVANIVVTFEFPNTAGVRAQQNEKCCHGDQHPEPRHFTITKTNTAEGDCDEEDHNASVNESFLLNDKLLRELMDFIQPSAIRLFRR